MAAPAPTTLRITDGRRGRAEMSVAKSRVFQLTAEEAQAAPDVVTGMYLSLISLFIFSVTYVYVFCYRIVLSERHIGFGTV